ncbi:MAG: hypothetical protein JRI31_01790 [Deltaproteobacteria bacterium]|nr:hypothetical protein [Deltaproteobacteria bacterium]
MTRHVTLAPEELEFLQIVGYVLMSFRKWEKAALIYDLLQNLMPEDIKVAKARALIAINMERYERALEIADIILEKSSSMLDHKDALIIKTRAFWALGQREKARECFSKAISLKEKAH